MANDGVRRPSTVEALAEVLSPGLDVRQVREVRDLKLHRRSATTGVSAGRTGAVESGTTTLPVKSPAIRRTRSKSVPTGSLRVIGDGFVGTASVARRQNRRGLNALHGKDVATPGLSGRASFRFCRGRSFSLGPVARQPRSSRPDRPVYRHERERRGFIPCGELRFRTCDAMIDPYEGDTCSFPTEVMYNARNVTDQPSRPARGTRHTTIPDGVVDSLSNATPARTLAEQN